MLTMVIGELETDTVMEASGVRKDTSALGHMIHVIIIITWEPAMGAVEAGVMLLISLKTDDVRKREV